MIILVGASASGKTEAAKLLIKKYGFKKMVTTTTRAMRDGEIKDVDYHFMSKDEFINRKNNNEFLETTLYNDNYYGTHKDDIGEDKVLIVEVEGANKIYKQIGSMVKIFFLEASDEERKRHMILRGDRLEDVNRRIEVDRDRFAIDKFDHIDYVVLSDCKSITELADEIYKLYTNNN